ncbi:MAG: sodium:solute symporter [Pirellulales bacterium]
MIHPIDLAIVAASLLAVVAFGLWMGRGQRNVADYLLGNRNIPWWALLVSIVATETSTVTFLSVPGLAYAGDMTFLQLAIGYLVGKYIVVALLLPQYFRGQLFTAYEVLDRRFGRGTRRAASLLFMVTRTLADGLRLFLTAIVLKVLLFSESPADAAFDSHLALAVVVMGTATILYTVAGGIKAVVWTDVAQFFIYMLGALSAGAVILHRLSYDWPGLVEYATVHEKLRVFDFSFDLGLAYTFWAGLIGGAFFSLGSHGADQLMVQRYLSARGQSDAARALRLSGWVVLGQFALFLLLGVGLACFYQDRAFGRADEVFPTFIVHELPLGVVGLTLSAVFAAAMSTLSSSLNSSAAAAVNDFYIPLVRPAAPGHTLWVTRGFTVLFGLLQITVGIAGQYLAKSVIDNVMLIAAFTMGIILGLFFLGLASRRAGGRAALVALAAGLAGMTYIALFTSLAWPWYAAVGSLGTLLVGLAAGRFWPDGSINEMEK